MEQQIDQQIKQWNIGPFTLTTDKSRLQLARVHAFLSTQAYWCLGIPFETVEAAVANSMCFGLYDEALESSPQVGFVRVVTDHATFAWICDVYVEEAYRGNGLAKWMIKCVMSLPILSGLRRICLATKDAHGLYEKFGFMVSQSPKNWMEIKDNEIYSLKNRRREPPPAGKLTEVN